MDEALNPDKIAEYTDIAIEYGSIYGLKVVAAIAIFIIGKIVARSITKLVRKALEKNKVDQTLISFIGNIAYSLMLTFVVIAALSNVGIETSSLAAIIAAAGLAIGLALQGSLSNLAAGVMLIIFRPLKIGDFVEAGGATGVVEDVNIFTTRLKTGDNKAVIVPNSAITGGSITNYSMNATRRVDLVFGCGYNDDLKKVKSVLQRIVSEDERILKDPAVTIAVSELADSSVNFVVRPWVATADYWGVYFDLTEKVKLEFDKEGISIPFPQQDVHMHNVVSIEESKAA